jgi:hypothetical protein
MIAPMMWRKMFLFACLALTLVLSTPLKVLAEDAPEVYDARLQGYSQTVQIESGSTALTWLLLIALGVLCLGVLFKDAKRSHLD